MNHSDYMQKALQLAKFGWPKVAPNPMVGCVIVKDGKIIAEGYHKEYGGPHAEVNAINSLAPDFDFTECTLYVNLEPCSHEGKTPPCSDLLVTKKFKKVVICNTDTNPLVGGKGIERLKKAGIEVESGILEQEGRELNKRFVTFHEKKRPYMILKWAQTNDGFVSKNPIPQNKSENWITGDESKKLVHEWRAQEQAIMVGTTTVINDNPELTVRLAEGKNPIRIVIDKDLKLKPDSDIFNAAAETLVFTGLQKTSTKTVKFLKIDFSAKVLEQILNKLYTLNISSVILEGGTTLLQSFIKENLWDEARVFINPDKSFGSGTKAPEFDLSKAVQEKTGTDNLYQIKNPH
ncbi:MAG: bifunctional diaminohydroxyphosphoribosylaminopyrimidine deaminase/5-amino-6-(5-phosphoribosylamino)uracil reductase RibD [Sphingobacteriaceae bacterium]|nr:bifunctional diaminohydroxyphosphoribosylaminopyrimidine deaminase/5-amino-6-(5-phosphoribosylamino)uracil reductase RibD [Sphingobacteriaceae bacterium]